MAGVLLSANALTPVAVGAATTRYINVGCSEDSGNDGTEPPAQIIWRTAGTFSNLYQRVTANTATAASTVKFRVAAANGSQSLSIGSASTGEFQDTTDTDVIGAGTAVAIQLNCGAGGSITRSVTSVVFNATAGLMSKLVVAKGITLSSATNTSYSGAAGGLNLQANETNLAFKSKTTGTLANLFTYITTNSKTTATTFNSRVNAGAGSMSVSVGSASTGYFEDLVHSDVYATGSTFDYQVVSGSGSTSIIIDMLGSEFITSGTSVPLVLFGPAFAFSSSLVNYFSLSGVPGSNTVESVAQNLACSTFTASNIEAVVSTNGNTTASTLTFRLNGGNGNQIISIGSHATGYFEDTTDVDVITSTSSELALQFSTGTGGNITLANLGVWVVFPSGVVVSGASLLAILGVG